MNNSSQAVLRAVRGPILLITLGTLFAVDYYGRFSIYRTGPVLLIVFGLLKLLEMLAARGGAGMEGAGGAS